jgi:hypothetical protein
MMSSYQRPGCAAVFELVYCDGDGSVFHWISACVHGRAGSSRRGRLIFAGQSICIWGMPRGKAASVEIRRPLLDLFTLRPHPSVRILLSPINLQASSQRSWPVLVASNSFARTARLHQDAD